MQSLSWTGILIAVIFLQLLSILIYSYFMLNAFKKEREALIDRLMAKDYQQYKQFEFMPIKNGNNSMKPILPMTDEELYWLEQKKLAEEAERKIHA